MCDMCRTPSISIRHHYRPSLLILQALSVMCMRSEINLTPWNIGRISIRYSCAANKALDTLYLNAQRGVRLYPRSYLFRSDEVASSRCAMIKASTSSRRKRIRGLRLTDGILGFLRVAWSRTQRSDTPSHDATSREVKSCSNRACARVVETSIVFIESFLLCRHWTR